MQQTTLTDFPPIDKAYADPFGEVDPIVYDIARDIWPTARQLADEMIGDHHLGADLMLKAVASVSAARRKAEIANLRSYLFRAYRNTLLTEFAKRNGHRRIIDTMDPGPAGQVSERAALERRILIDQCRDQMEPWMREVFDLLVIGFTFVELVPRYGSSANAIRSKFSKKLRRLTIEMKS
jgi:DNA-directed RNA polymerase specialized sigma24 family protein